MHGICSSANAIRANKKGRGKNVKQERERTNAEFIIHLVAESLCQDRACMLRSNGYYANEETESWGTTLSVFYDFHCFVLSLAYTMLWFYGFQQPERRRTSILRLHLTIHFIF